MSPHPRGPVSAEHRPGLALRPAQPADLPTLRAWLPAGADLDLPAPDAADECWLVLARTADGVPQACLRLRRAIGLQQPRHWYHVGCVVHAAAELGLFHRLQTLQLGNDHTGACELADIAWQPGLDLPGQARVLQALVAGALAQVRAAPTRYAPQLIVELPGLVDAAGRSPFWLGLGRPFFAGDTAQAARRFGPAWRGHVAALMPRQPVYTAFLPAEAQAAIGQVAPAARVLVDVLWQAGLRYGHHITIDQGGPVFEASVSALRTDRHASL